MVVSWYRQVLDKGLCWDECLVPPDQLQRPNVSIRLVVLNNLVKVDDCGVGDRRGTVSKALTILFITMYRTMQPADP